VGFLSIAAFPAAPNAGFVASRESDRDEHGTAFVANLTRENPMLCEEFIRLLDSEQHD
jgi:hypothetical protein